MSRSAPRHARRSTWRGSCALGAAALAAFALVLVAGVVTGIAAAGRGGEGTGGPGAEDGDAYDHGEAPRLYLEAPSRVAAGAPFELFVSSSLPVALTIRYGDHVSEAVEQDLRLTLTGRPGEVPIEVLASDASGRAAEARTTVMGLQLPEPVLDAPARATVGDPLAVRLSWHTDAMEGDLSGALVADAWVELDGRVLEARAYDGGLLALSSVPLADQAGSRTLRGVVVDEFGTWHRVELSIEVVANPNPVQLLAISTAILAVSTPEGRELEARTLAEAFALAAPDMRWGEPFLLPIFGRSTSGFGVPRRYGAGGAVSYHLGADLATPEGTPILATNDGVVLVSGHYPIKGGLVVIDHGLGVTSLYFHQSRIAVEVGDQVRRGDVIGFVGSTGLSTGPHLHWEMRVHGVPTDPMAWVDRYLPLPTAALP